MQLSELLVVISVVVFFSDKPGPVQDLRVKEVSANTVTMRWSLPLHDGGRDVTGYVVEKREGNRRMWQSVTTTEATEFEIPGLFEGNQYNFRISAENSVGVGEPVETTDFISPRSQFSKYSIFIVIARLLTYIESFTE